MTTVIDLRLTSVSRDPGYSKRSLGGVLAEAGSGYRNLPELGSPKDNRDAFRRGERGKPASGFLESASAR